MWSVVLSVVASKSVLVVEDDPAVQGVLRIALRRAGFTVSTATSGTEALRLIDEQSPDGVILDLMLPDGRSREVLELIKEEGAEMSAWLVVSAMDPDEVHRLYGDLGRRFFPKPFDPWDLANSLRRALR
jgi:two-component system OmpR family response regulator